MGPKVPRLSEPKKKYIIHKYSVVELEEDEDERLFECIPDRWFVDELRERCFFPPRTGRTFRARAISCEKPKDEWSICICKVVSTGYLTYSAGFNVVKEKCAQSYNTSSAEEHLREKDFRRKHPTSICGNVEFLFTKKTSTTPIPVVESTVDKNLADTDSNRHTFENGSDKQTNVTSDSCAEINMKVVPAKDSTGGIDDSSKKRKRLMRIESSSSDRSISTSRSSRSIRSSSSSRLSSPKRLGTPQRSSSPQRSSGSRHSHSRHSRSRRSRSSDERSRRGSRPVHSRIRTISNRILSHSRSHSRSIRSIGFSNTSHRSCAGHRRRSHSRQSFESDRRSSRSKSKNRSYHGGHRIQSSNKQKHEKKGVKDSGNIEKRNNGKKASNYGGNEPTFERDRHRSDKMSPPSSSSNNSLIASVNSLAKTVADLKDQMVKNDRRLNRLEVKVNKIFITVGDMNGNNRMDDDIDAGIDFPELPISSKTELYSVQRQLKDKQFRRLWLLQERNFCCPTKTSTDCVTITKYLKRFVSLDVRCQLTLKERSGRTLFKHYNRVYEFLIDVMKQGYRICGKQITQDDAHTALRVVWGRSKQLKEKK